MTDSPEVQLPHDRRPQPTIRAAAALLLSLLSLVFVLVAMHAFVKCTPEDKLPADQEPLG